MVTSLKMLHVSAGHLPLGPVTLPSFLLMAEGKPVTCELLPAVGCPVAVPRIACCPVDPALSHPEGAPGL